MSNKAEFTCNYCGYKWIAVYYAYTKNTCLKCHDKNLKIKPFDNTSRNCYGYNEDNKETTDIFRLDTSVLPKGD